MTLTRHPVDIPLLLPTKQRDVMGKFQDAIVTFLIFVKIVLIRLLHMGERLILAAG